VKLELKLHYKLNFKYEEDVVDKTAGIKTPAPLTAL
jgi:hypothetical protein